MATTLNSVVENYSSAFSSLVERYSMDAKTILFVRKDNRSYAYNYDYYQNNAEKINKEIDIDEADKITHIYFKVTTERDSWIDYDKAIKLNTGSIEERIQKALIDPTQRIESIKLIPECIFTDVNGYRYKIMPFDGLYLTNGWCQRVQYDNLHETKFTIDGNDVIVEFPENVDIRQSFISLNKYFYPFNIINENKVIFKNIVDELKLINTINEEADSIVFNVKVYTWRGLKRSTTLTPIRKNKECLYFDRVIGENGILIYNNLMYDYDLDYDTKKMIRIKGLNQEYIDEIDIKKIRFYILDCEDKTMEVRKFITNGINNRYRNRVNFLHPVNNSIILFENVDHEYEVLDLFSIYYPSSIYSVNEVKVESEIISVNFIYVR